MTDISALATGGAAVGPTIVSGDPNSSSQDINGMFQWTPDSRAIVYNADFDIAFQDELYWVDVSGTTPGTPVRLVPAMPTNGDCGWTSIDHNYYWSVSPDGTRLAALCEAEMDNARYLYTWDISGTVPGPMERAVENAPTINRYFLNMRWSPDSQWISFVADLNTDNAEELFLVDMSGTFPKPVTTLSTTMANATYEVYTGAYHSHMWSPNSQMIAWTQEIAPVNGPYNLMMADLSQGPPYQAVQVNAPYSSTSDDVWNMQFSPDNTKLAAFGYIGFEYVLHVVDLTGPMPTWNLAHSDPLSSSYDLQTLTTSGWRGFYTWFWTADSSSLVYTGALASSNADEGWITNVTGMPPYTEQRLTPTGANSGREIFNIWAQGQYSKRIDSFWR